MRINSIHIENFLSFDLFSWPEMDPQLNIIVGPNGAGKTNLLHALRAVKDSLSDGQVQETPSWSQLTHRHLSTPSIKINLDIQFTEDWEKQLLYNFILSAICDERAIQGTFPGHSNPDELAQLSNFLLDKVHLEDLDWLFTGQLIVSYDGLNWNCRYEGKEADFHLHVKGLNYVSLITGVTWINFLKKIYLRQENMDLYMPRLHDVLKNLIDSGVGYILQIERPHSVVLPTHQAFERLAEIKLQNSQLYGVQSVFRMLLKRAFVFTDNIRRRPLYKFSENDFSTPNINLSNGEQLALYLFKKKNGTFIERKQFDNIKAMFSKLTNRSFEISLKDPSQPGTNLDIHLTDRCGDVPLDFSGAGITEALFLSTILTNNKGQVVLLDEPALTMHTTMQKSILREIRSHMGANKQFIITTHSPTMIDPDTIIKTSYFSIHQGKTFRSFITKKNMDIKELARLEQELRKSTESRALLFSRGVILVEGETELAALPIWFEKEFNQSLEAQDLALYSVGGDQNFKPLLSFLQAFNIPWAIICDGKVINYWINSNRPNKSIIEQLEEIGINHIKNLRRDDFSKLCQELEQFGVFTLAKNSNDEIEALPIIQKHLEEARSQFPKSKVRQGQYIATKYDCPSDIATILKKVKDHLKRL